MARTQVMLIGLMVLLLMALPLLGACGSEKVVEVPVEKVVEKEVIKEVPVEKIVEKEVIKEVPVEKPTEQPEGPWDGLQYLRLMGAASGSTAFSMMALLASCWTEIPDITASAVTGADKKNIEWVSKGQAEFGYASVKSWHDAVNGEGYFAERGLGPITNLGWMSFVFSSGLGIFVRSDSDIQSIEDIWSKRIAFASKGMTATMLSEALLKEYGITVDNIGEKGGTISNMAHSAAADGLRDKTIDVHFITFNSTGANRAHFEAEESFKLRLIPIPTEKIEAVVKNNPGLAKVVMPSGVYKLQTEAYPTIGNIIFNFASDRVTEDLAYEMLKRMYAKSFLEDKYWAADPFFKTQFLENGLVGAGGIRLHPGAAKFYAEYGIEPRETAVSLEEAEVVFSD